MLTKLDKKIISRIARDIPLVKEPFSTLAVELGMTQHDLLTRIRSYQGKGLMRKFAATLNHKKIGFTHNTMVVWNVPAKFVDKSGKVMASFRQVSHCYQRKKAPDWNYNLYSMIHGRTKKECLGVISEISENISCKDYEVLFSCQEYKKAGAKY